MEPYEYQEANMENKEQFFVVQNDGTALTVDNNAIQFVTQADNGKEVVSAVPGNIVYNVAPQQFYVDNSNEVISASDQFILPAGENNMYGNSYLLQSMEKDNVMVQDESVHYEEEHITTQVSQMNEPQASMGTESDENKTNGDCTEITLTDEQYQILEQKGWILLQTIDKIYLLDTLGLHDITDDKKLIEKLQNESNYEEESSNQMETGEMSQENAYIEGPNDQEQYVTNEEESVAVEDTLNDSGHLTAEHDYVKVTSFKDTTYRREGEALRIKTKFSFKDIPPEIVLGRTVHGKKLVASVKTEKQNLRSALSKKAIGEKFQKVADEESEKHLQNDTGLEREKLEELIKQNLLGITDSCSLKDVTAAEIVVDQLLRVPAFKTSILERRLLITKVVIQEHDPEGNSRTETHPTLVTGRVIKVQTLLHFKHIPDLLQRTLSSAQTGRKNLENNFLHIHVCEMKGSDGITRISITLNKNNIPLENIAKKARSSQKTSYACSACGAVYGTEEGLKLHQEIECVQGVQEVQGVSADPENVDVQYDTYTLVFTPKGREYMCNHCENIFSNLNICQQHIKSHFVEETPEPMDDSSYVVTNEDGKKYKYKCKICANTFTHAASLSKHIAAKHLKIKQ